MHRQSDGRAIEQGGQHTTLQIQFKSQKFDPRKHCINHTGMTEPKLQLRKHHLVDGLWHMTMAHNAVDLWKVFEPLH